MASKPLPQNLEAEQSVLGSVLIDSSAINQVLEILGTDDFYKEAHRKIFGAMIELDSASKPIDVLSLYEYLKSQVQLLEDVGGSSYITYLPEVVPSVLNVGYYAKIVKEKAMLRKMIETASVITREAQSEDVDIEEFVERSEQSILDVAQNKVRPSFYDSKELTARALEIVETMHLRKEHVTGIATGFQKLDYITSGFQPSDLIVLASRPGLGKTSLSLDVAVHAAVEGGHSVGIFSLEMTKEQLILRMLSGMSEVNYSRIRSGFISDSDLKKLFKKAQVLSEANIFIDDTPAITVLELRAKARRQKREKRLDLLIVDYLQLMRSSKRTESREREIAEISASLKALAKELEIPIIAISQLSRQTEARVDRRPQLSDLRESGALEQDADVVIFIHRQDAYRTKPEEKAQRDGIAEIIVEKQRNGPTGTVKLLFLDQHGVPSFRSITEEYEDMEIP
ncbi:MAG: replicative DNA helicase [Candidatus Dadabacteria bacterium]|nr:replicative DNA helicase [Candidatus Dadabacteria bacterium]